MKRWIMIRRGEQILSAWMQDQTMIQIQADPAANDGILGNIYVGRVKNIVKTINAAFIEIAGGRMGYYSMEEKESPILVSPGGRGLRIGDELLVQVAKEAVKTKAPVLTGKLNLTGRYAVLVHGLTGTGVSSKIPDGEERLMLKAIAEEYTGEGFGYIIRTNARTAGEESFRNELVALRSLYERIQNHGRMRTCFSCVYQAPQPYLCALRDSYDSEVDEILTDDEELYRQIAGYLEEYQPENTGKLRLHRDCVPSLESLYGISHKLSEALKQRVGLKCGGNIVSPPTEALTVIDVNTGRATEGKKNVQETFRRVNLEAAAEIARQIRLRNLSGIILVDFIDMTDRAMREELKGLLETLFREDPIQTRFVDMTALNLVEITRKKIRKPLYEQVAGTGGVADE